MLDVPTREKTMSDPDEFSLRKKVVPILWIIGINLLIAIGFGFVANWNNVLDMKGVIKIIKGSIIAGLVMGLIVLIFLRNAIARGIQRNQGRKKLPSELLQEEFDRKYPHYSPKLPPAPPIAPEQKDNPYRYE